MSKRSGMIQQVSQFIGGTDNATQTNGATVHISMKGPLTRSTLTGKLSTKTANTAMTDRRMSGSTAVKTTVSMGTTQTSLNTTAIAIATVIGLKWSAGTPIEKNGSTITRHCATLEMTGAATILQSMLRKSVAKKENKASKMESWVS